MKKIELLAPAGSYEALRAVCAAGADAVYVGGNRFGARAYAKNFTDGELLDAIDYVHLHGKKIHLAVNTLLKEEELEGQLYDYMLPLYERGLDAAIVQDAGVFSFLRRHFPGLDVHASTQTSIAGAGGARFWQDAGASRAVLARELSIEEIRAINDAVSIELECFVHGALCYCYSGQCLFSSMIGARSGNRGRCAQPCRLPYAIPGDPETADKYPLSMKDLCALDLLPEIICAGADSLKIEGRMKQAGYAAGVTAIYRKYLDMIEPYLDDRWAEKPDPSRLRALSHFAVGQDDMQRLMDLGNRCGFTDGYLRGVTGRAMLSLDSPGHESSDPGQEMQQAVDARGISGTCQIRPGEPASLRLEDALTKSSVTIEGDVAKNAISAPVSAEEVERVIRQTGDTGFEFTRLDVHMEGECFIQKSSLRKLRRDAVSSLRNALLSPYRRDAAGHRAEDMIDGDGGRDGTCGIRLGGTTGGPRVITVRGPAGKDGAPKAPGPEGRIFAVCDTMEQARLCASKDYVGVIGLELQAAAGSIEDFAMEAAGICRDNGKRLILGMPSALRLMTRDMFGRAMRNCILELQSCGMVAGFLAKNYDTLGFLHEYGIDPALVWLDGQIYTWSARAWEFFRGLGYVYHSLPLELDAAHLRGLPMDGAVLAIYGHAPFMASAQCPARREGCGSPRVMWLTDRQGRHLPVKNYCVSCTSVIYNPLPMMLFSEGHWGEARRIMPELYRMDFTVESAELVRSVLAAYERQVLGRETDIRPFSGESTRGRFKRGAL